MIIWNSAAFDGWRAWHLKRCKLQIAARSMVRSCLLIRDEIGARVHIAITKYVYGHLLEGDKRVAAEPMSQGCSVADSRCCTWTSELAKWCRRRTRDEGSDRLAERVLAAAPAGV